MIKIHLYFLFVIFFSAQGIGQKNIAITIDDVPKSISIDSSGHKSILLEKLDSLDIPFTIFVNEGLLYKTDSADLTIKLLEEWCSHKNTLVGNHTYSHSRYSEVGLESFKEDITKGEQFIMPYMTQNLKYFRFPYNDLGKDSIQHVQIDSLLSSLKYFSTPFTVESSDWMFNAVYLHYLENGNPQKAKEIGELYVSKTMELLNFYDSLSFEIYNRSVDQIYLCHDNVLNQDYLQEIMRQLDQCEYQIIPLDAALQDQVYNQSDLYMKKWGISWFYRWMPTRDERMHWMKIETDFSYIESLFEEKIN